VTGCRSRPRHRHWPLSDRELPLRLDLLEGLDQARQPLAALCPWAAEDGLLEPVRHLARLDALQRNSPRPGVEDGRADLDPMTRHHVREMGVVARQPVQDRLVTVLGDDQPGAGAHHLVEEHLLVIRQGLDDDDVDVRVSQPEQADMVGQGVLEDAPRNLVGDALDAEVRDAAPEAMEEGRVLDPAHIERRQRVDDDDQVGALVDGDVHRGGSLDATVDVVDAVDPDRFEDDRDRAARGDRVGDADLRPGLGAEDHPLPGVEATGHDVELLFDLGEVDRHLGQLEDLAHERADLARVEQAARQRQAQEAEDVADQERPAVLEEVLGHRGQVPGQLAEALAELADVGREDVPDHAPLQRKARVASHVDQGLGRDPDAEQRGDEGARAGAHVDVEVEGAPVEEEVVKRSQHAELVDPSRDPSAGEHESGLAALAL